MLKTIRQVPDEADRKYLRDWARDEFKRNKNSTNQVSPCRGAESVHWEDMENQTKLYLNGGLC